MTIICPRCAARFSVAGTTGITCPACGARLALRDDPSRRSSTPATANRRSHPQAPVIDLPIPKRAPTISLDPIPSLARLMPGPGGAPTSVRSTGRAPERWRLKAEQLADLPEPVAELPRAGRKGSTLRSVGASKAGPAAPIPTPVERAAPRIPVTRPEIPAGQPVRVEPAAKRPVDASSVEAAAATKQELAPIRTSRQSPEVAPPVVRPLVDAKPLAAVSPVVVADVPRAIEPSPVVAAAPAASGGKVPGVTPAERPPGPIAASIAPAATVPAIAPVTVTQPEPKASPGPSVSDRAAAAAASAPTLAEASVASATAAAPKDDKRPATDSPNPTVNSPGELVGGSSDDRDAAPPLETEDGGLTDENKPPAEIVPPPSLQLGWVIALLLGLTVLLIVYILYRASTGH